MHIQKKSLLTDYSSENSEASHYDAFKQALIFQIGKKMFLKSFTMVGVQIGYPLKKMEKTICT
jgi:hypothetical protein